MDCREIVFSGHAVRRMFERGIGREAVASVSSGGEVIAEYPDDSAYPSQLGLGLAPGGPIHVVVGYDSERTRCIVITVYEPGPDRWASDFRTRRK
jgi:hypothetical protein